MPRNFRGRTLKPGGSVVPTGFPVTTHKDIRLYHLCVAVKQQQARAKTAGLSKLPARSRDLTAQDAKRGRICGPGACLPIRAQSWSWEDLFMPLCLALDPLSPSLSFEGF